MEFRNELADNLKKHINYVEEIGNILSNGVASFQQNYKGQCSSARENQGNNLNVPQYLSLLCEQGKPYLKNNVINPLLTSLLNYRDAVLGTKAITRAGLPTMVKGMLSSLHRFIVISMFFGVNTHYVRGGNSPEDRKIRKDLKKVIMENNRELIGCGNPGKGKFNPQKLAAIVSSDDRYRNIKEYFDDQCISIRRNLLTL